MNKPLLPAEIIQYILAIRSYAYNQHWKQHKIRVANLLYRSLPVEKTEFLFGPHRNLISFYWNRLRTIEITLEQEGRHTLVIKVRAVYLQFVAYTRYRYFAPIVVAYTTPSFLEYQEV